MEGFVGRFLSFDKMMTGSIIKVIYYIGLVLIPLGLLFTGGAALFNGQAGGGLLTILIGIPIAVLLLRVYCEIFMVMFRISDNLTALRKLKETEVETLNKFD